MNTVAIDLTPSTIPTNDQIIAETPLTILTLENCLALDQGLIKLWASESPAWLNFTMVVKSYATQLAIARSGVPHALLNNPWLDPLVAEYIITNFQYTDSSKPGYALDPRMLMYYEVGLSLVHRACAGLPVYTKATMDYLANVWLPKVMSNPSSIPQHVQLSMEWVYAGLRAYLDPSLSEFSTLLAAHNWDYLAAGFTPMNDKGDWDVVRKTAIWGEIAQAKKLAGLRAERDKFWSKLGQAIPTTLPAAFAGASA